MSGINRRVLTVLTVVAGLATFASLGWSNCARIAVQLITVAWLIASNTRG